MPTPCSIFLARQREKLLEPVGLLSEILRRLLPFLLWTLRFGLICMWLSARPSNMHRRLILICPSKLSMLPPTVSHETYLLQVHFAIRLFWIFLFRRVLLGTRPTSERGEFCGPKSSRTTICAVQATSAG